MPDFAALQMRSAFHFLWHLVLEHGFTARQRVKIGVAQALQSSVLLFCQLKLSIATITEASLGNGEEKLLDFSNTLPRPVKSLYRLIIFGACAARAIQNALLRIEIVNKSRGRFRSCNVLLGAGPPALDGVRTILAEVTPALPQLT